MLAGTPTPWPYRHVDTSNLYQKVLVPPLYQHANIPTYQHALPDVGIRGGFFCFPASLYQKHLKVLKAIRAATENILPITLLFAANVAHRSYSNPSNHVVKVSFIHLSGSVSTNLSIGRKYLALGCLSALIPLSELQIQVSKPCAWLI